jgi:hypothetical protein
MEPNEARCQEILDRSLADGKAVLDILGMFTDGIIVCKPLDITIKMAKGIIEALQVSY